MEDNFFEKAKEVENFQEENRNDVQGTFLSIIKDSFVDCCLNTSAHAIPNIFRTTNWVIRVPWLFLFLVASGASIYCKTLFFLN